jgi:hypothetical protein
MLISGIKITIGHLVHTASVFSAVLEIMSYTFSHVYSYLSRRGQTALAAPLTPVTPPLGLLRSPLVSSPAIWSATDAGTVLDLLRRAVDGPCFLSHYSFTFTLGATAFS